MEKNAQKKDTFSTAALLEQLFKTTSFERFLERNGERMQTVDFGEYIRSLCKQKGLVRERVIQRSGIERTYGHQIFRGIREPSRDKVLQLAIGFGLNPEEAGKLLRIAGKSSLYPKIKRDAAILFCIQRGKTIIETQLLLEHLGFSQLGDKSC